ncbi:MAG: carboxylating nicotinate-nucleotide diphosphorylase [Verrucomicrobiota bacterium JB023]|nr:carboxylating nicotinate-nucleotide diphosphorylase [Verrucomicrobiota bacterium JB023]
MDEGVSRLIDLALAEDIGSGDVTSEYFVPADSRSRAYIRAREEGVIAGTEVAAEVFRRVDGDTEVKILLQDGARVVEGALVMEIQGSSRSVLTGERVALNFLQRLSGVATLTRRFVDEIKGTGARILDTRKTTPGWRLLEKAAVVAGGGSNHRMGLYDRAMVKDNHLAAEGGLDALQKAIKQLGEEMPGVGVELEADHLQQVEAFLKLKGVDQILLDNMSLDELKTAVSLRRGGTPFLEASGGVKLDTVRAIAETGVDFVSVGAVTHSAVGLDLGLDFMEG